MWCSLGFCLCLYVSSLYLQFFFLHVLIDDFCVYFLFIEFMISLGKICILFHCDSCSNPLLYRKSAFPGSKCSFKHYEMLQNCLTEAVLIRTENFHIFFLHLFHKWCLIFGGIVAVFVTNHCHSLHHRGPCQRVTRMTSG